MTINQISVFLENRVGQLAQVCKVLAENDISLVTLSLAETQDFGIARLIVDDVLQATTVLRDAGYIHSLTPVLGVAVPDEPGGLSRVLTILDEAQINVEYLYAFLGGKDTDSAYMIFRVQDEKKAAAALSAKGIRLVDQEEMSQL